MKHPETIFQTPRLTIREYTPDDAEEAFALYGDPEVMHFLGGNPHPDVASLRAHLEKRWEREHGGVEPPGFWAVVTRDEGRLAGTVLLKPLPGHPEVEVGWHLAKWAWGRGYATEAARGTLDYGFHVRGLERIVAVVHPLNHRSLAVARRLGMRLEGRIEAYQQELELFVLSREEWDELSRDSAAHAPPA
ncbi:MAG: GNAT family N-acetyltransferase [Armatimonadota bacterium]